MSKEHAVIKFIEKELPDYQWHIRPHIKKANRYPDLYLDLGNIKMIIQIDENKHKYYKDEKKSMNDITKALGTPTIFIRFNPDSYWDCNGEFHKSCWKKVNGKNILRSEEEHDDRLWNLSTVIMSLLYCNEIDEYYNIEESEKLFYVVHKLYYNKYNPGNFYPNPFEEDNYEICDPNSETDSEEEDDLEDDLDDEIESEHDTDDDWKFNCKDKSESEPEYEDDSDESESEYDFDESASEYEDSESDDDCIPPPSKRLKID
jgi:hypothetical protein